MGNFRTDSVEDYPVESRSDDINYILVYEDSVTLTRNEYDIEKREMYEEEYEESGFEHYKSTKSDKESLLSRLHEIEGDNSITLLGVWPGKWRTDVHELELPRFVERMEAAKL